MIARAKSSRNKAGQHRGEEGSTGSREESEGVARAAVKRRKYITQLSPCLPKRGITSVPRSYLDS